MSKLDKGQIFVLGFFIGGVCGVICLYLIQQGIL